MHSLSRHKHILLAGVILFAVKLLNAQPPSNKPNVIPQVTRTAEPKPIAYPSGTKINYVRTHEALAKYTLAAEDFNLITDYKEVKITTQYIDGLGRPIQTVSREFSPGIAPKDLIAPVVYDNFGREVIKYLPYVSTVSNGNFKMNSFNDQSSFMQNQYPGEQIYYGKTVFESSPLNRIQQAFAPGNSWAGSSGTALERAVKTEWLVNTVLDDVWIWNIDNYALTYIDQDQTVNIPTTSSSYLAGELMKNISKDEEGNAVVEYKDKQGQVILKKVQAGAVNTELSGYPGFLCTYYIYDHFNRLRFVIPPKATEAIRPSSGQLTSTIINELCFRYEYDARGRMIAKKVPGAGWVYMVYDQRDRLVFTQDANLRTNNQWMVTLYDQLNRPVTTGMMTGYGENRDALQSHVNAVTANNTPVTIDPIPSGTNFIALTITYYDDYAWTNKAYTTQYNNKLEESQEIAMNLHGESLPTVSAQQAVLTAGLVTGIKVRTLDDPNDLTKGIWLCTASFYDDRLRVIQTNRDNYRGGTDIVTNRYDFNGKLLNTYLVHNNPAVDPANSTATTRVRTSMKYDHAGRLLESWKTINDDNAKRALIAINEYDELGQLKNKKLGKQKNSNGDYLSTEVGNFDYSYNIRGWLKGINKEYANNQSPMQSASSRWFGMELNYDWGFTKNQYNGNIGGIKWRSRGDGDRRAYGFGYDKSNRLMSGDFSQNNGTAYADNAAINFDMMMGDGNPINHSLAYDENGNIKSMKQWGVKLNNSAIIDQLAYNYTPSTNKLLNVIDNQNDNQTKLGDFRTSTLHPVQAKTTATIDYTYDLNGNLKKDLNKDIGSSSADGIEYNHLNLPWKITVKSASGDKGTITYVYDATGNKITKTTIEGTQKTITYYSGAFVYETKSHINTTGNDVLQFIGHEEGRTRYIAASGASPEKFEHDYFVKDHLGNVRMVLTEEYQIDVYPAATLEGDLNTSTDAAFIEKGFYTIDPAYVVPSSSASGISTYQNNNGNPPYNNNPNSNPTANSAKLYQMNSATNKTGLGITLKVMAGDAVDIFGKSYFLVNGSISGSSSPVPSMDILNLFAGSNGMAGKGISGTDLYAIPNLASFIFAFMAFQPAQTSTVPKAYINWILVDERFNYMSAGCQSVGSSGTVKSHSLPGIVVQRSGYIFVYCGNESPHNVFFDNLQVIHRRGALLEETHYYPFGLTMAGISSRAGKSNYTANKRKYNGIEFDEDLDLNHYEAFYRILDPQIGKFLQIDPKVESAESWSPYTAMLNNPILHSDPLGDSASTNFLDKDGNLVKHVEDGSNAVFQQKGTGVNLHYSFSGFDKSQNGSNDVNLTTAVQEQQTLNIENPALQQNAEGQNETHCNQATQAIMKTVASVSGDKSVVLTGNANTMVDKLNGPDKNYFKVNINTAKQNAKDGGVSVIGYKNPTAGRHGHILTFSVGNNIEKGETANVGLTRTTGFNSVNSTISKTSPKSFYIMTNVQVLEPVIVTPKNNNQPN